MATQKTKFTTLLPVLLSFFVMGFVDLVGIASNYVKADLNLSDAQANFIPSLLFFWFLIFSIPTGMLMNKIGRKKTVMISLIITCVSLFLPVLGNGYALMLAAFSLLGIANAILQVALNPLMSSLVSGDRLASSLTLGQFVKAIASFLAPMIAAAAATGKIYQFGLDWRVLFPIYLIVCILAALWLGLTKIEEAPVEGKPSTFMECFGLLGKSAVLLAFIGILCHVGIDVGVNTTTPKIFQERLGMTLDAAAFATSLYFICRMIGSFAGTFLLNMMPTRRFFIISMIMMLVAVCGFFVGQSRLVLYASVVLIGLANSNIFSMVISQAFLAVPEKQNEISSLMIMGLFGGTLFPLLMGLMSDKFGQNGAVAIIAAGAIYLLVYALRIKNAKSE